MIELPCLQEVLSTEPADQGDEGEWDMVGEPAGSRSPALTVEELLAQLERQPPAPQGSTEPAAATTEEVVAAGVVGRLHSIQGLAQSNNNTKLNNSAKTYRRLLETKCKGEQYRERGPQETKQGTEQKDDRPCSTSLYALGFFFI
jgi:hypothetical protein